MLHPYEVVREFQILLKLLEVVYSGTHPYTVLDLTDDIRAAVNVYSEVLSACLLG